MKETEVSLPCVKYNLTIGAFWGGESLKTIINVDLNPGGCFEIVISTVNGSMPRGQPSNDSI